MTEPVKTHSCVHCDYKSAWKHNVTRHMVTKHNLSNVHTPLPNVHNNLANVHNPSPNVHNPLPNVHNPLQNIKTCTKCTRVFATKYTMLKHSERCKGVNRLQCEYCNKIYASRASKCNHLKACPSKMEAESKALVSQQSDGASGSRYELWIKWIIPLKPQLTFQSSQT